MADVPNITLDDFLEYILPNVDQYSVSEDLPEKIFLHGTEKTSFAGCQKQYNRQEQIDQLKKTYNISINTIDIDWQEVLNNSNKKASIVNVNGANPIFITVICFKKQKIIYIFDSGLGTDKLDIQLSNIKKLFPDYELAIIGCQNQLTNISICHAFLNASMMLWGVSKYAKFLLKNKLKYFRTKNKVKQIEKQRQDFNLFLSDFQNYAYISKQNAVNLASYALLSDIRSNPVDDYYDEETVSDRQTDVDEIIKNNVKQCMTLSQTIQMITKQYEPLDEREKMYINRVYFKHCVTEFCEETEEYIKNTPHYDPSSSNWFNTYLKQLHELDDLKKYFGHLKHYDMLITCAVTKQEHDTCLQMFKKICWAHIISKVQDVQLEIDFNEKLEKYLRFCFLQKNLIFGNNLSCVTDASKIISTISLYLKESNDKNCLELANIAKKMNYFIDCSEMFAETVSAVIKDFLTPVKHILRKDNKIDIEYEGRYANLSTIIQDVETFDTNTYKQVNLFIRQLLYVDTDLYLPGINLVVMTSEIYVDKMLSFCLNISGRDGKNKFDSPKASDGCKSGDSGEAGLEGNHGESGGNMFIKCSKISNSNNISLISNGGNGSNGQHGGHGKMGTDGSDGKDCTRKELDNEEPWYQGVSDYSWCFLAGGSGTLGTPGGNGGQGGKGGIGGYEGHIYVVVDDENDASVHSEHIRGNDGKRGDDGDGGSGGRNGNKGCDQAYMKPSIIRKTRYYSGNIELSYHSEDATERVWNKDKKMYMQMNVMQCNRTFARTGEKGAKKLDISKQNSQRVYKKTPISVEEVVKRFEACQINNPYCELQLHNVYKERKSALNEIKTTSRKNEILQTLQFKQNIDNTNDNLLETVTKYVPRKSIPCLSDTFLTSRTIEECKCDIEKLIGQLPIDDNTVSKSPQIIQQFSALINDPCLSGNKEYVIQLYQTLRSYKLNTTCQELISIVVKKYRFLSLQYIIKYVKEMAIQFSKTNKDSEKISTYARNKSIYFGINVAKDILYIKELNNIKEYILRTEQETKEVFDLSKFESEETKSEFNIVSDIDESSLRNNGDNDSTSSENELSTASDDSDDDSDSDDEHNDELSDELNNTIFVNEIGMHLVSDLPNEIKDLLNVFDFVKLESFKLLSKILLYRFCIEGVQLSFDALKWIVTSILHEYHSSRNNVVEHCILIFASENQNTWLIKYIVYQLSTKIEFTIEKEELFLKDIMKFKNKESMLILLSDRLANIDSTEQIELENIISILDLSYSLQIDENITSILEETNIENWIYRLRWFHTLIELNSLNVHTPWQQDQLISVSHSLCMLRNLFGDKLIDNLMTVLINKSTTIKTKSLLNLLQHLQSRQWKLNEQTLNIIFKYPCLQWKYEFKKIFESNNVRSLEELIKLMVVDSNNSINEKTLNEITTFAKNVQRASERRSDLLYLTKIRYLKESSEQHQETEPSYFKTAEKNIKDFSQNDISQWNYLFRRKDKNFQKEYVEKHLVEVLAIINQAVIVTKKFPLRDTQILSVAIFLNSKGMLQQVATGEGKTLIISVLSIIKVLEGYNVDIITSSAVLAKRDSEINNDLFNLFDVKVGNNCSDLSIERKDAYVEKNVVFGEIGCFQRDILLDEFYNEDLGITSRNLGFVIVDEVDSMLLDRAQNVLYLSHSIPGMEDLESVYTYIWQFVHAKDMAGTIEDIESVKEAVISAMHPMFRKGQLDDLFQNNNIVDYVWHFLVTLRIIDNNGKILTQKQLINNEITLSDIDKINECEQKSIISRLKDVIRQDVSIRVPSHLDKFVDLHLHTWIENAFSARWMTQNDDYVIDINRTAAGNSSQNIIIMDKDTGIEQYNSQWSKGLHQFLQLKHGCRLSTESLKAVFISNVTFFMRYSGRLWGLSGTLGSKKERDVLKTMYNVNYATIPSFRPSQFDNKITKICSTEKTWLDEIYSVTYDVCELGRPVLIICESVQDVDYVTNRFSHIYHIPKYIYKRTYEPLIVGNEHPINSSCIIIATNLAGRGTDLKISDDIDKIGGLHVLLTYHPPSQRVEEQAFGRSARKGQKGSGQIICLEKGNVQLDKPEDIYLEIVLAQIRRNNQEEDRIAQIKHHYDSVIRPEENYFHMFSNTYRSLKCYLQELYTKAEKNISVILASSLDEWAFWLDMFSTKKGDKSNQMSMETFLTQLEKLADSLLSIKNPRQRIKLAKLLIDSGSYKEAMTLLKSVLCEDKNDMIAHYYMCHLLIKQQNLNKAKLLYHLQKSIELLNERCELLSNFAVTIPLIADAYKKARKSFLFADDYKKQKEDTMNLLSLFTKSLQDIAGHEVNFKTFDSHFKDPVLSIPFFQCLLESNILHKSHKSSNIEDDVWQHLHDKYERFFFELESVIKTNSNLNAISFKNILPNREEFWNQMKKSGILFNEKTYVIIDKTALNNTEIYTKIFDNYKTQFINAKSNAVSDIAKDEKYLKIWLYPEHFKVKETCNLIILPFDEFEQTFGNWKAWKTLEHSGILRKNKTADCIANEAVQLGKFDSMEPNAFIKIHGVDQSTSLDIYQYLQTHQIISDDIASARLLVADLSAIHLETTSYNHLESEILNIIEKSYCYRLAYNDIMSEDGSINLESKPHKALYTDLVAKHVIEPVKINANLNDGNIKEKMDQLFKSTKSGLSTLISKIDSNVSIEDLWECLFDMEWMDYEIIYTPDYEYEVERICENVIMSGSLDSRFKTIEYATKSYLLWVNKKEKNLIELSSELEKLKSGLGSKFENADSKLIHIGKQLDEVTLFHMSDEVYIFENNGFSEIICLQERKWTLKTILSIGGVILIGFAQIALAVILEVFTLGAATMIASGLFSEGISDIMFGIECACTGYFSWMSYLKNKAISIAITVATAGIGAYFARGAKYSRYGAKVAGEYAPKVGKELIKGVGLKRLSKEIGIRVMKKLIESGALAVANVGIDAALENLMDSFLKEISNKIIGDMNDKIENNANLKKALNDMCDRVGMVEAQRIMTSINSEMYSASYEWHQVMKELTTMTFKIGNAVSGGISKGAQKLGKCGDVRAKILSNVASFLSKAMEEIQQIIAAVEIATTVNEFLSCLESKIFDELKTIRTTTTPHSLTEIERNEFYNEQIKHWKDQVNSIVKEKIINEFGRPLLQTFSQMAISYTSKQLQKGYSKYKTYRQYKRLNKLEEKRTEIETEYKLSGNAVLEKVNDAFFGELNKLLKKTRDPKLYVKMIEMGGPVGIHCIQAISDILNRPIKLNAIGAIDRMTMPEEVHPTSALGKKGEAINIDFHVGTDESFGHFASRDNDKSKGGTKYDCLFEAVSNQVGRLVTRDQIVSHIQQNKNIRANIKKGLHEHFIRKGGIGGVARKQHKIDLLDALKTLTKTWTEEDWNKCDMEKLNRRLRDYANKEIGALRGTGNHEFIPTDCYKNCVLRSKDLSLNETTFPLDYVDVYNMLRTDTKYIIFKDKTGKLHGHSGTLQTKTKHKSKSGKKIKEKDLTKGQPDYHQGLRTAFHDAKSPLEATQALFSVHFSKMIPPDEFKQNLYDDCISAHGYNLETKKGRDKFARGYKREYYKNAFIASAFGADIPPIPSNLKNDPFLGPVQQLVSNIKSGHEPKNLKQHQINQLQRLLHEPAPAKKNMQGTWKTILNDFNNVAYSPARKYSPNEISNLNDKLKNTDDKTNKTQKHKRN